MFYYNIIWLMETNELWSDFVAKCSMVTIHLFCGAVSKILNSNKEKSNKAMQPTANSYA